MRFQYPSLVTLSSFAVSVPPSPIAPYLCSFSHKVFLWSIHWVQSPHQLVFNFLASIPVPSCSASYETRSCVYLYLLSRLFLLSISRVFTAFSFFSLCFSFLLPTLSSSVLFLLISSLSSTQLYHRAAFIPANTFPVSILSHS